MTKILTLALMAAGCMAQTSYLPIIPPANDGSPGMIGFREKRVNGANEVQLAAPDAIASTIKLVLPDSLPPTGGGPLFFSDTGHGSWIVETSHWRTAIGKERVFISNTGVSDSSVGIVRVYTGAIGAETISSGMDNLGVTTWKKFRACETTSGYCATLEGSVAMTSDIRWTLPEADSAGALFSDGSGHISITANGFVTTGTPQTGISATKQWTGNHTWDAAGITFTATGITRQSHSGEVSHYYNGAGADRVFISNSGSTSGSVGIVRVYTGAPGLEGVSSGMDAAGVTTWKKFLACEQTSGHCATLEGSVAMSSDIRWILPPADAAGVLQSDGFGNLSISTGAPWVDLTSAQTAAGNKTWTGNHIWGVSAGLSSEVEPGKVYLRNASGALRVQMVQPGTSTSAVGIVRVYTGAVGSETISSSMDSGGVDSSVRFSVSGTTVIDSSRNVGTTANRIPNVYGENIQLYDASGNIRSQIVPSGLNWYSAGGLNRITLSVINAGSAPTYPNSYGYMDISGPSGSTTIDNTGINTAFALKVGGVSVVDSSRNGVFNNLTISGSCTGCPGAITNYVTNNSSQSAITGAKQINGGNTWTWGSTSAERMDVVGASIKHYNASNYLRIQMTNSGSTSGSAGIMRIYTGSAGSETIVVGLDALGITVNGLLGINLTCSSGQTVRQPRFEFGVLVSGVCGI